MPESWREIVAEKRQKQLASIPTGKDWNWIQDTSNLLPVETTTNVINVPQALADNSFHQPGILTQAELEITNSDVEPLLACLANGTRSASEVTLAFAKRAILAHLLTNCLTEIFIERALARAAELDRHLQTTGKVLGPLHGLPISLKDQINIMGIESTMGYVSWIGKPAKQNSVLADILESLGAILFVKTNVPQTLMWGETFNHVFGRTLNPHNRKLTCGGSSGGEGAVIALKGAAIGVGSDVGGSIRIPAAFCGTYGLRPSYGRIPYAGCMNSLEGQESILSVLGPLSNSIYGIKLFVRAVLDSQPWLGDPLVVRKKWDEDAYQLSDHGRDGPLCFAVMWDDRLVVPHPPVIRALNTVKASLLAEGHKVVDWDPLCHNEILEVALAIWKSGMAEDVERVTAVTGEPVITSMELEQDTKHPIPSPYPMSSRKKASPEVSAYQLWQLHKRKRELRERYLEHWQATESVTGTGRPVDAVVAPVAPFAAPPHGKNCYFAYTTVWNALDYPALVIPVTKVHSMDDLKVERNEFLSGVDQDLYESYDPETFRDAPVSVQVVGRTLEEEAVIAMGEIVDDALKKFEIKREGSHAVSTL